MRSEETRARIDAMIIAGFSNGEVARECGVTTNTAAGRRWRLQRNGKLGLSPEGAETLAREFEWRADVLEREANERLKRAEQLRADAKQIRRTRIAPTRKGRSHAR